MDDLVNLIKEISIEHPAIVLGNKDFDSFLQGIEQEVENGYINYQTHPEYPHLRIYKYSMTAVTEKHWNIYTLISRGLILDVLNKKVVAITFPKFFNYNEISDASNFIESEYLVTEKIDGSMGILFNYENKWMMSTLGSFSSEQSEWGIKWANRNMPLNKMDKENTYLFEIVYKENKIVINYDFEGLVLLSIYDKYGLEYSYEMFEKEAQLLKIKTPKIYNFNDMNSIVENAKNLEYNFEGYVIRFKNGVRLKVKGDEYVRIHRLICYVTPLAIWEALLNKTDLKEISDNLPEEIRKDFWTIVSLLNKRFDLLIEEIKLVVDKTSHMTDKELGLMFSSSPKAYIDGEFPKARDYVFAWRKGQFEKLLDDPKHPFRRNLFNNIKPAKNKLDGYVPSNVMNRFNNDIQ